MSTAQQFYDAFAADYDHFVNWPARLKAETPFIISTLAQAGVHTVLDVAGGTGQHAIALAKAGFTAAMTDISPEMVRQSQRNATEAGVTLPTYHAGFGELAALGITYDALLCLGNSLPHILDLVTLRRTVADMAAVVRRNGVLIWQLRNFERILACQERFMGPQAWCSGENEELYVRFYDFIPPYIRFNLLRLQRQGQGAWSQTIEQTTLYPWTLEELREVLSGDGWEAVSAYGNLGGEVYRKDVSDLVLVATKTRP